MTTQFQKLDLPATTSKEQAHRLGRVQLILSAHHLTVDEKREMLGLPAFIGKNTREQRLEDFKKEVRKMARAARLSVEFFGDCPNRQVYVQFSDDKGRFGVFIGLAHIWHNTTEDTLAIVRRNITRKDRAQW